MAGSSERGRGAFAPNALSWIRHCIPRVAVCFEYRITLIEQSAVLQAETRITWYRKIKPWGHEAMYVYM